MSASMSNCGFFAIAGQTTRETFSANGSDYASAPPTFSSSAAQSALRNVPRCPSSGMSVEERVLTALQPTSGNSRTGATKRRRQEDVSASDDAYTETAEAPRAKKARKATRSTTESSEERTPKYDRNYLTDNYSSVECTDKANEAYGAKWYIDRKRTGEELRGNPSLHKWWKVVSRAKDAKIMKRGKWVAHGRYECVCGETCTRSGDMDRHVAQQHYSSGLVKCELCPGGRMLKNATYLRDTHVPNVHGGVRPHVCPRCDKTFADPSAAKKCCKARSEESNDTPPTTLSADSSMSVDQPSQSLVSVEGVQSQTPPSSFGSFEDLHTTSGAAATLSAPYNSQNESLWEQAQPAFQQRAVDNNGNLHAGSYDLDGFATPTYREESSFGMQAPLAYPNNAGMFASNPHTAEHRYSVYVTDTISLGGECMSWEAWSATDEIVNGSGGLPTLTSTVNPQQTMTGDFTQMPYNGQNNNDMGFLPNMAHAEQQFVGTLHPQPMIAGMQVEQMPFEGFNFTTGFQPQDTNDQLTVPPQSDVVEPRQLSLGEEYAALQQRQQNVQAAVSEQPVYNPMLDMSSGLQDDVVEYHIPEDQLMDHFVDFNAYLD